MTCDPMQAASAFIRLSQDKARREKLDEEIFRQIQEAKTKGDFEEVKRLKRMLNVHYGRQLQQQKD